MRSRPYIHAARSGLIAAAAALLFVGLIAPNASAAVRTKKASVSSRRKQGNGNSAAASAGRTLFRSGSMKATRRSRKMIRRESFSLSVIQSFSVVRRQPLRV